MDFLYLRAGALKQLKQKCCCKKYSPRNIEPGTVQANACLSISRLLSIIER